MSTWFSQDLIFGYKTTYKEFESITGGYENDDYDQLLANNRIDGWGWIVSESAVIYGKHLLSGESYGNDNLFAAESGVIEIPRLKPEEEELFIDRVKLIFPDIKNKDVKYYIVGDYN